MVAFGEVGAETILVIVLGFQLLIVLDPNESLVAMLLGEVVVVLDHVDV